MPRQCSPDVSVNPVSWTHSQVLASLDENMQRYGDMLTEQQRSVAVSRLSRLPSRSLSYSPPRLHFYLHEECCLECMKH